MTGGLGAKTPDELYVALLKSDSLTRALDERMGLRKHYKLANFESLRKSLPAFVRIASDKKSGVITVEVDDEDAKFAADLANGHYEEVSKVLSRLAVSDTRAPPECWRRFRCAAPRDRARDRGVPVREASQA